MSSVDNLLFIQKNSMYVTDFSNALNTNTKLLQTDTSTTLSDVVLDISNSYNGMTFGDISNVGFIYHNKIGNMFPFLCVNNEELYDTYDISKISVFNPASGTYDFSMTKFNSETTFVNDASFGYDQTGQFIDKNFTMQKLKNFKNIKKTKYFSNDMIELFRSLDNSCNIHLITCDVSSSDIGDFLSDISLNKPNHVYFSSGKTGNVDVSYNINQIPDGTKLTLGLSNNSTNPITLTADWILEHCVQMNNPYVLLNPTPVPNMQDVSGVYFTNNISNNQQLILAAGELIYNGSTNDTLVITQNFLDVNLPFIRFFGFTVIESNVSVAEDITFPNDITQIIDNSGGNIIYIDGSFNTITITDFLGTTTFKGFTTMLNGSSLHIKNLDIDCSFNVDSYSGGFIGQNTFSLPLFEHKNIILDRCNYKGDVLPNGGGLCGYEVGHKGTCTITNCSFTGNIGDYGGGIGGLSSFTDSSNTIIENCSSEGDIGIGSGGILGAQSGKHSNITIKRCFHKGFKDSQSGGMCGSASINEGSLELIECYSDGDMSLNAGGLLGDFVGFSNGFIDPVLYPDICGNIVIRDCFSKSNSIMKNGGGIAAIFLGNFGKNITIDSCYTNGEIQDEAGGLTGPATCEFMTEFLHITNCFTLGDIKFDSGGIIGKDSIRGNYDVSINRCYVAGDISNVAVSNAGGIFGFNCGDASMNIDVENCYITGDIGPTCGSIAPNFTSPTSQIIATNCYSTDFSGSISNDEIRANYDVELLNNGNLDPSLNNPYNGYIPDTFANQEFPLLISFRDNTVWLPDTYTNYNLLPGFAIIIGPIPIIPPSPDESFVCDKISNQLKFKKKININTDNRTLRIGSLLLTNVTYKSINTKVPGDGSSRISMLKSKLRRSYNCNGI